jgi:hypothetical protein
MQGRPQKLGSVSPSRILGFAASADVILLELHFAFDSVDRGQDHVVRHRCYMMVDIEIGGKDNEYP